MTTRTFIIAEAGVNHNGDVKKAIELIDIAADCGADAVKFQTFQADRLATKHADMCDYQRGAGNGHSSQRDMLSALELPPSAFVRLAEHCSNRRIEFMSTAFDGESLDFLVNETGIRKIKIPSGELVNPFLLLAAARRQLPIILSTGLATLDEVRSALQVVAFGMTHATGFPSSEQIRAFSRADRWATALAESVSILHCVSNYPAPPEDTNLSAMETMRAAFDLPVGLSDHTLGLEVATAAVALRAAIIEKHFTLDPTLPGPDHQASLSPKQLSRLVSSIRTVEKAIGNGTKSPRPSEIDNHNAIRGSLVAACRLRASDVLSSENVTVKRPGNGLSPMRIFNVLGKTAGQDLEPDEPIPMSLGE